VDVDDRTLRNINVISRDGKGNPGMLRSEGRLRWPLALKGDDYRKDAELIDTNLPDAVKDARDGRADASTLNAMMTALDNLNRRLQANVRDLPPAQYQEAKRFLTNLGDALTFLRQPDAAKFLNKEWADRVRTAEDLVKTMTGRGLRFAPAVDGQEPDYMALHQAMAAYDISTNNQAQQIAEKQPAPAEKPQEK
jgi:hypothetical protein